MSNCAMASEWNNFRYDVELRDGKLHGWGTLTFADGGRYEGEFRDGKMHGRGSRTWPDGGHYEGQYRDNKPHGWGTSTMADGRRFEGQWRNGCFRRGSNWAVVDTTAAACGFE